MSHPLPSTFEVDAARRAAAAQDAGQHDVVAATVAHLAAEGSTEQGEATLLKDVAEASLLARKMVQALGDGDAARAAAMEEEIVAGYGHEVANIVLAGMLITVGRDQGWLPEKQYDLLMELTSGAGSVPDLIGDVRRGKP